MRLSRKALTSASPSCKSSNCVLHIDVIRSGVLVTVLDLVFDGMMMQSSGCALSFLFCDIWATWDTDARVVIVGWNAAAGHQHASSPDEFLHNTALRNLGRDSWNWKAWRTSSHRTGNSLVCPC